MSAADKIRRALSIPNTNIRDKFFLNSREHALWLIMQKNAEAIAELIKAAELEASYSDDEQTRYSLNIALAKLNTGNGEG